MYTITLADKTRLENLELNGNNYIAPTLIDDSVFEGNLGTITISDGATTETQTNMMLIQNTTYGDDRSWFILAPNPQPPVSKRDEINTACKAAIYAGVEVNGKRYALTEEDQINLSTALKAIEGGAEYFLYHADGDLCEPFPASLILTIMDAAVRHKIYHTTYCNHLNAWIRRAEGDELAGIYYGAELPPDLAEHMAQILGGGDG